MLIGAASCATGTAQRIHRQTVHNVKRATSSPQQQGLVRGRLNVTISGKSGRSRAGCSAWNYINETQIEVLGITKQEEGRGLYPRRRRVDSRRENPTAGSPGRQTRDEVSAIQLDSRATTLSPGRASSLDPRRGCSSRPLSIVQCQNNSTAH